MRRPSAAYHKEFIKEAPLAVVCRANPKIASHHVVRGGSLHCLQDVAASIGNLMLAAFALGLGTLFAPVMDRYKYAVRKEEIGLLIAPP